MKKYKTSFSKEELNNALHKNDDKALEIIENAEKWEIFKEKLEAFIKKAYKLPVIGGLVDDIVSMIQLVDSYIKKEYTDIPLSSLISIVGALIYVLSPIDLIPDAIPIIGYVDDAAVVLLVISLGAGHDLKKYKKWQDEQRDEALKNLEKQTGELIKEMLEGDSLGTIILGNNCMFRILAVVDNTLSADETPLDARVIYLNLPVAILKEMFIETEAEYLSFLNGVIDNTEFEWSSIGQLPAIHEADYEQYEDYFALVEGDDYE